VSAFLTAFVAGAFGSGFGGWAGFGADFTAFGGGAPLATFLAGCDGTLGAGVVAFGASALLALGAAFTALGGSFLAASRRGAGPALAADLGAASLAAGFGIGFDIVDFFLSGKGV